MAASPQFKVYSASNEYRAALKYAEDAAAFVAILGDGATIRHGHSAKEIVWREGEEEFSASESYERAATRMYARMMAQQQSV
jgi:hypothetical protein